MVLAYELELVWQHVRTDLINLEQIDILRNRVNMKVPDSIYLAPNTVRWLVSPYTRGVQESQIGDQFNHFYNE